MGGVAVEIVYGRVGGVEWKGKRRTWNKVMSNVCGME